MWTAGNRHRNSDVARAVRKTRDRLSQQAGNPDFDRELLKLHARAMISGAIAIPLLVLAIAAAGRLAGVGNEIGVWALFTLDLLHHRRLHGAARRPHGSLRAQPIANTTGIS